MGVMGELAVLDGTGDTKHIWDADKDDEVDAMRTLFDTLKKKGYAIFRVEGKNGEKGEKMKSFDPAAGKMIAVPPIAGG